jgi:hypothetical protein
MILAKIENDKLVYVKELLQRMKKRDNHMEIDNLEEGEYYLFVELPDMKENKSFVVTSYGASEAEFLADEADKFSKR